MKKQRLASGLLNLKGNTYGSLKVLYVASKRHKGKRMWVCKCECGTQLVVRHDYLLRTNNPKTHCGCKNRGLPSQFPEEYHIHNSMLRRCYVTDHVGYPDYGGRGIQVCQQWRDSFEQFLNDVGPRPSKKHTLDRKNPNGHYEPGNVQWKTVKEQNRNKRNSIFLPHPKTGVKTPAAEVAEILGIKYQSLRAKYIKLGLWPGQADLDVK